MSDEYVRREDAVDALMETFIRIPTTAIRAKDTIKSLESADVIPVVHSRWVLGGYDDMYYICEKCNYKQSEYYVKPTANFCPNCGADMRGEQDG